MKYPIVIRIRGDLTAFDVVVPDMPGCFSAGDTFDEAVRNTEEAALAWIEATLDAGAPVPAPSSIDLIKIRSDYDECLFKVIDIAMP